MTTTDLDLSASYADSVESGLVVTQDTLLDGDISSGVVYINQAEISVDAVSTHGFTASKDTYVDVGDDAVITYTETVIDAGAPALASDAIRLAKVVTDGTEITTITDLRTLATGVYTFNVIDISGGSTMELYNSGASNVMVRFGSGSTVNGMVLDAGESRTVTENVYVRPTLPNGSLLVTK